MDNRQLGLQQWLETVLQTSVALEPIIGDASFRRYFRLQHAGKSFIAMDSPPEKEDCKPYIKLAQRLAKLKLNVPEILFADVNQGYLLISDLGDELYHPKLTASNADQLYSNALRDLLIIQKDYQGEQEDLPHFGWQAMENELNLFTEWFLEKYLELKLTQAQYDILNDTYQLLLTCATEQPQTFVHRDYHCRNLMILPNEQVGILDFQDAVVGPVTYDLASLLRDCYIDWPLAQVHHWVFDFYQHLLQQKLIPTVSQETFLTWFDLMGMQRHLKAIFIFARKYLRDGNNFYLQFIPRALHYVNYVTNQYPELANFQQLLNEVILPAWNNKVLA